MQHTSWSAADGLLGEPAALAQTSDGFLWIGTNLGLYRFDGIRFEQYQPERGRLPAAAISALAPAPDGGLWVGYASGGISLLTADGGITSYSIADSLPIGKVRSIAVDHDGTVWVAAIGGLARLESDRWHKVRMDWNYPCHSAWDVFVERDGTLWVGAASPNRVVYLPRGSRRFVDIGVDHSALSFVQVDDSTIGYVLQPIDAVAFVRRTPGGAVQLQEIDQILPQAIAFDGEGGLWVAGIDISRFRLRRDPAPGSNRFTVGPMERVHRTEDLQTGISQAVLVDREGSVWGTTARGLDRFRHRNVGWVRDTIIALGASLVTDKSGDVWLLALQGPWIRRVRDSLVLRGAPAELAHGTLDHDGGIWLAGWHDVVLWKDGKFTRIPPPREVIERKFPCQVLADAEDRSGRHWASINGLGVFYRKDQTWTFVPVLPGRPDWAPLAIQVDAEDRVWLGYPDEIAMVQDGRVRVFSRSDSLNVGPLQLLRTSGRDLWVGGELGLALRHGERFYTVRPDGADFGSVSGIVPTGDGVWLTTALGIVHIPAIEVDSLLDNPAHRVRYELFDAASDLPDVLSHWQVHNPAVQGRDGVLWFLTHEGIASIDPRRIVRNPVPPGVIIRDVTADDRRYPVHQPLSLPPLTRTLQIGYTASSLAIPSRVRFRYRLAGWDDRWHDAGPRREVSWNDLRPGRYTLQVLASNNDGVWSTTAATLPFTVQPAWFQTAWFRALVAIAVLAGLVLAYRIRVRRVATALSARFEERLAERTRIARDLHDTLLQTVQGTRMFAQAALVSDNLHEMRQGMERVTYWLGRAVDEGRRAVQTLRGFGAASRQLAEALAAAAHNPGGLGDMKVSVAVHGAPRELRPIVGEEVYRIGYEAIRNVHAHARASQLDITVEYGSDLTLRIVDNGQGIDPTIAQSGKPGHFGLRGMRERARSIGATLGITGDANGTTIRLVVPGRMAFGG